MNPSPHTSNNVTTTPPAPSSRSSNGHYSGVTPNSFFSRRPLQQKMPQMVDAEEFRDFAVNISAAITAIQDQINDLVSQHIETRKSCQDIQGMLEIMKHDAAGDSQKTKSSTVSNSKKSDPGLCE